MTRLNLAIHALASLALIAVPGMAQADNQDTIDYRQHIMASMGQQTAAIGQILQKKVPDDNFALHLQTLAAIAATAKKAFEPKVPGGEAKPEIWTNWSDFSKRLDELSANTADLAGAARQSGVAAVAPKIHTALNCKSCHDVFREPKK
jgi:cytochrome c556